MSSRPSKNIYGKSSDSDLSWRSSTSLSRYSMESHPVASVEVLRCLRCAREVETTTTDDPTESGMIQIAQNLYYCQRCAKIVGYK